MEQEIIGTTVSLTAQLHRYRFPTGKAPVSGEFAIVTLDLIESPNEDVLEHLYTKDGTLVMKGHLPRLEPDLEYQITATIVKDRDWGMQLECETIHLAYDMSDPEAQRKFFSFFMTERQIDALFELYDNPIVFLENKDIEALTKVKGVGPATANRMCMRYCDSINNSRAYVELKDMGITKNAIDKIVNQFGSADIAVDIIKSNPYQLIKLVRGYGWTKADAIALRQGFTRSCKERCVARARYELDCRANLGSSCMNVSELLAAVALECAPASKQDIGTWIKEDITNPEGFEEIYTKLVNKEKDITFPTFYYEKESKRIGLFFYRLIERQIIDNFVRLSSARSTVHYDKEVCEEIIHRVEQEQGYQYAPEQIQAIWNALEHNVSILTGSAGSGKSSTLKPLVRILKYYNYKTEQSALSGRAASLLTEYTGLQGKTIHRLLGFLPEQEEFAHHAGNPINADFIILDEASMVGEELFLSLISAIRTGSHLIMLGDLRQLPPMAVGNILNDSIQSGYIPTTVLTKIHRQALKSGIIGQSFQICEGKSLVKNDFSGSEIRGELRDFKLTAHQEAALIHNDIIEEYKNLLRKDISEDDIQIVVATRLNGMNSCRFLNAEIQELVNNSTPGGVKVDVHESGKVYSVTYKKNDRVMVTKNNYHARTILGKQTAIFNGNMGHITSINEDQMIVELEEQGEVVLDREDWDKVTHSWACTCHKMQGSQAPYTIVGIDNSAYPLLSRQWLYTAITRAKKYCSLIGQPTAINLATRTNDLKGKETWLKGDLYKLFIDSVKGEQA